MLFRSTSQTVCVGYTNAQSISSSINGCAGTPSYQWLLNGAPISGATNGTYQIPTGLGQGTYNYTLQVSCGGCTSTSSASTFTVTAGPTVSITPTSQTACVGYSSAQSLSSTVSGCTGTPTYQWLLNGSAISGATNATYSIPTGLGQGTYNYTLQVSCGGCTSTSSASTFTVTAGPTVSITPTSQTA